MPSGTNDQATTQRLGDRVRSALDRAPLAMLTVGLLSGYGLVAVGRGTVSVPVVGEVSGIAAGATALLVATVLYTQAGGEDCGCSGDCNGGCSVDS